MSLSITSFTSPAAKSIGARFDRFPDEISTGPGCAGKVAETETGSITEPSFELPNRDSELRLAFTGCFLGLAAYLTAKIAGKAIITMKIAAINSGCTSFHS